MRDLKLYNKALDFNGKEMTSELVRLSKLTPLTEHDRHETVKALNILKTTKKEFSLKTTEQDRAKIPNYTYLCFTIDRLEETIRNYDIITDANYRFKTLLDYISDHHLTQEQIKKLIKSYDLAELTEMENTDNLAERLKENNITFTL